MTNTAAAEQGIEIESLSAITLSVRDMRAAVRFYETLGFRIRYGGADQGFTSFVCGGSFLNLILQAHGPIDGWGRFIVYVSDVDGLYRKVLAAGLVPSREPGDAPWGERYFHISDPDGHEVSIAKPLG